jgi:hypothetical protein
MVALVVEDKKPPARASDSFTTPLSQRPIGNDEIRSPDSATVSPEPDDTSIIYLDDEEDDVVDVTPLRAHSPSMMIQRIRAGLQAFAENTQPTSPTPQKPAPLIPATRFRIKDHATPRTKSREVLHGMLTHDDVTFQPLPLAEVEEDEDAIHATSSSDSSDCASSSSSSSSSSSEESLSSDSSDDGKRKRRSDKRKQARANKRSARRLKREQERLRPLLNNPKKVQ